MNFKLDPFPINFDSDGHISYPQHNYNGRSLYDLLDIVQYEKITTQYNMVRDNYIKFKQRNIRSTYKPQYRVHGIKPNENIYFKIDVYLFWFYMCLHDYSSINTFNFTYCNMHLFKKPITFIAFNSIFSWYYENSYIELRKYIDSTYKELIFINNNTYNWVQTCFKSPKFIQKHLKDAKNFLERDYRRLVGYNKHEFGISNSVIHHPEITNIFEYFDILMNDRGMIDKRVYVVPFILNHNVYPKGLRFLRKIRNTHQVITTYTDSKNVFYICCRNRDDSDDNCLDATISRVLNKSLADYYC